MAQVETVKESGQSRGVNTLAGFIISKLNRETLVDYVKRNNLESEIDIEDESLTDEQIGVAVHMNVMNTTPVKERGKCTECTGVSSVINDKVCPYCGDEGDPPEQKVSAKGATSSKKNEGKEEEDEEEEEEDEEEDEEEEEDEDDEEDEEDEEDEDDEEEESSEPTEEKSAKALTDDAGDDEDEGVASFLTPMDEDDEDEEEVKPTPKTEVKPKNEKKNMASTETANGTSTAKKGGAAGSLVKVEELDTAVKELISLRGSAAEAYWQVGRKLNEISQSKLYTLRMNEKTGKAAYKSFDAFVSAECNMTPTHAYDLMDLAKEYKTPAAVQALGATRAILLLKANPKDRAELTEKAKKGMRTKDLKAAVKDSRKKHGSPKAAKPQSKGGTKGAAAKAKVEEKITVASLVRSKQIKLYCGSEIPSKGKPDWKAISRATSLDDKPFGRYEMVNGVVMYVSVLVKDGELIARLETRRED